MNSQNFICSLIQHGTGSNVFHVGTPFSTERPKMPTENYLKAAVSSQTSRRTRHLAKNGDCNNSWCENFTFGKETERYETKFDNREYFQASSLTSYLPNTDSANANNCNNCSNNINNNNNGLQYKDHFAC